MPTTKALNPTQIHILEMFSHCKDDESLQDLKSVLANYYAQRLQNEADSLWEQGILDGEAIENIGKEHWRIPYSKV